MSRSLVNCRLTLMAIAVAAGTWILTWRLWQVQIVDERTYATRLHERSELTVRIPPVRGKIRDRNGVLLAGNRGRFDVEFYLPDVVKAYRASHNGEMPIRHYRGRSREMWRMFPEPDIGEIVETFVEPRLAALHLPDKFDAGDVGRHFRTAREIPYVYLKDADFETAARFTEHDGELPGARIAMAPVRTYPLGALASHLLGYVGDPEDISELPDARNFDFYRPNIQGKAGVEKLMDRSLSGTPGARVVERDEKGVIGRQLRVIPPRAGTTVSLTIDARLQFIAARALRAVGRAAAVVVDPRNGDILAMASVPSFDPNAFVPKIAPECWKALAGNQAHPLMNRALCAFPPGSTFKLITALAGVRAGIADDTFSCHGGVQYGNHYFKCWKSSGHGALALSDAIKVSCNGFFYQYGNAAGIGPIDAIGTALGLGRISPLNLTGEQAGILPSPTWLRVNVPGQRWTSAYTANVSIGQGYDLVTPLQLATAYAAIANGGMVYYPRLIMGVANGDGEPARDEEGKLVAPVEGRVRADLHQMGISDEGLETIREGLWKVVNEDGGTARRARLTDTVVAGKTGTAQAKRGERDDTIAWFACFAPFDEPRYAVCVMVQGGAHGGSVAAPIAARILHAATALEHGSDTPPLLALEPASKARPFAMIESVDSGIVPAPEERVTRIEPARNRGPAAPGGLGR